MNDMTTNTASESPSHAGGEGFFLRRASGLVPRLRRLRRDRRARARSRQAWPPAARGRAGIRHRLLVAAAGLYQLLRIPRRAWPRLGGGGRPQTDASRSRSDRRRRRRRRLFDRRQSFHPRLPAQCRHALSGDGQPRLRHDQGPAVADHRAGLGQPHRARRHRTAAVQSVAARHRGGSEFRGAWIFRRPGRPRRV